MTEKILEGVAGSIALLESDDFYADVSVSSSPLSFYRRLTAHPVTQQLIEIVRASPENARAVLNYADNLARSIGGSVRSEKDAALCACVVALAAVASPTVDDFLRYLRTTRELALRWASDVAEIVSRGRTETVQTSITWSSLFSGTITSLQAGETRTPREYPSSIGISRCDMQ